MKKFAKEYRENLNFVVVDIDEFKNLAKEYNVSSDNTPNVKVCVNGYVKDGNAILFFKIKKKVSKVKFQLKGFKV